MLQYRKTLCFTPKYHRATGSAADKAYKNTAADGKTPVYAAVYFFTDYSFLPVSEARLQNACHFSLTPEPVWREMEICRPSSRYRLFFSMRLA